MQVCFELKLLLDSESRGKRYPQMFVDLMIRKFIVRLNNIIRLKRGSNKKYFTLILKMPNNLIAIY